MPKYCSFRILVLASAIAGNALMGCAQAESLNVPAPLPTVWPQATMFDFDSASPQQALAAAPIALIGRVSAEMRSFNSDRFYSVIVRRPLYAIGPKPNSFPATINVVTSVAMGLPRNADVLLSLYPPRHEVFPPGYAPLVVYRVVSHFASIGVIDAGSVRFRRANGLERDFPVTASNNVGCFVVANAAECRRKILGTIGVNSQRRVEVYDALLSHEPYAGEYWVLANARRHLALPFPERLCAATIQTSCASGKVFLKQGNLLHRA
jgi:hypothetical protein